MNFLKYLSLAIGFIVLTSVTYAQNLVPLQSFFSPTRQDLFTTATPIGVASAYSTGYSFYQVEGCVFDRPSRSTVPLALYYSTARGDNFLTATVVGAQSARNAGYQFIRNEGYVFPNSVQDTVPLLSLFKPFGAGDNYSTTNSLPAQRNGYQFVRIEGYVYSSTFCR